MGREIAEVVEDSRKLTYVIKALNATLINLITKEKESNTPDRFWPISLCNITYKIISKVIENGIKPLLPILVSEEQAGIVEGR